MVAWIEMEQGVMRSRLKWIFAGISAVVVGYLLYRRSEVKRREEEQRRYLDREEKLRAIAAAMKHDGEALQTPPLHEEQPNLPTN